MDFVAPSNFTALAAATWAWGVQFVPRLVGAILIIAVGFVVARYVARGLSTLFERTGHFDRTFTPVLKAIVRYGILIFVVIAALGQLGVQTASVLAVLGAAGLALGLALQGTLSNIAAGLMLLWLRPFRSGDYIETNAVAGSVEELGLFHTRLRTWDGLYKFVPNSLLWNTVVTNMTRNPTRLVMVSFAVAYEDDIAAGRQILRDVATGNRRVLKDPPPQVVPLSLSESAVTLQLRAWTATPDAGDVQWDLTEAGKKALQSAGLLAPYPKRVLHVIGSSFEDGVAGAATVHLASHHGEPSGSSSPPAGRAGM